VSASFTCSGRSLALPLAVLLVSGCAGTSRSEVKGPPADAGHGSVEEVGAALERQGVPCRDPRPVAPPAGTEQAVECRLDGEQVLLVHFSDGSGSTQFEEATRASDLHGVYADTWAVRTDSAEAAETIARAVENRGRS
jgi:hypothetical protein